jgi:hypothetical protein
MNALAGLNDAVVNLVPRLKMVAIKLKEKIDHKTET